MKYQDLMDELKSLQGLLVLKSQCLAEEELNLKWFTIQEHVSTEKRKELSGRNAHLFQQKVYWSKTFLKYLKASTGFTSEVMVI